jgi:hypothetical protein
MVFPIGPRSPPYATHTTFYCNAFYVLCPNESQDACSSGIDADTTSKTSRSVSPITDPTPRGIAGYPAGRDTPPSFRVVVVNAFSTSPSGFFLFDIVHSTWTFHDYPGSRTDFERLFGLCRAQFFLRCALGPARCFCVSFRWNLSFLVHRVRICWSIFLLHSLTTTS